MNNGEDCFHWFINQNGEVNGVYKKYLGRVTTTELRKSLEEQFVKDSAVFIM